MNRRQPTKADRIKYNYYPVKHSAKDTQYVNPNRIDYHAMLYLILEGLRDSQSKGGFVFNWNAITKNWKYKQNNEPCTTNVVLKTPILFIMGDTEGHDKLCCLVGGNGNTVCQYCAVERYKTNKTKLKFKYVKYARLQTLMQKGRFCDV